MSEATACRYLMHTSPERRQAWRLDVVNDGKAAEFSINGEPITDLPPEITNRVLTALAELDTAFGNLMLANDDAKIK